jgi:chromosome partitioning protein
MRTIAIINQKGGCGKTTTSINLAACLARLGQKTLLVDMDPQGHCAVGLAVPEEQIERTIFDCLIEDRDGKPARLADVVWQIATDFDLGPANIKLAAFEQLFAGRIGREDRLRKAVETVRPNYKWCLIDCPPSVGLITFNALRACDEVIVPVETGYFSLHGLAKMMETLEVLRDKCDKEILIRVLPTLYDTRTKLAREVLSELRNKFKEYLMESTVNFNTKLKEAASFGQPITEYDPGSRGYKDFVNLARELMGHTPVELEPTPMDKLSRPAELVQRAKQLAQLTNVQFGRNTFPSMVGSIPQQSSPLPASAPVAATLAAAPAAQPRGPILAGRLSEQPIAEPSIALSSDEEELSDAGAYSRMSLSSIANGHGNGNGNGNGNGRGSSNANSNGNGFGSANGNGYPTIPFPKSTAQKIEEFYGAKKVGDEVIFAARFDQAKKVLIAGDFNNWSPMSTPMVNRGKPGEFWTCLPLQPGRYRYRFVVDGKWMTDPHNKYVEVNQFGELNNVIEVD